MTGEPGHEKCVTGTRRPKLCGCAGPGHAKDGAAAQPGRGNADLRTVNGRAAAACDAARSVVVRCCREAWIVFASYGSLGTQFLPVMRAASVTAGGGGEGTAPDQQ